MTLCNTVMYSFHLESHVIGLNVDM